MFKKLHTGAALSLIGCVILLGVFGGCNATATEPAGDDANADTNSLLMLNLLGLAAGNADLEISGFWDDGYYFAGTYYAGGKLVVAANADGSGSWATTGSAGPWGNCSFDGSGSAGVAGAGNDYFFRIIEYDNVNNQLYAQYSLSCDQNYGGPADYRENYMRISWTEPTATGCENGAALCFSYCQTAVSSATLAEAQASAESANATDVANSGCGTFDSAWSRALIRSDLITWN